MEGKHLGRLTFTWKEKNRASGERFGLSGISVPGLDGKAGRQGAHGDGVIIPLLPFPYLSFTRRHFLSLNLLCSQCEGLALRPGTSPPSALLSQYEGHRLWLHGQLTSFTISQMRCLPNLLLTKWVGIIPVFLTSVPLPKNRCSNGSPHFIFLFHFFPSFSIPYLTF